MVIVKTQRKLNHVKQTKNTKQNGKGKIENAFKNC